MTDLAGGASLLPRLTVDGRLLFATTAVRLFAYGAISVVLGLRLDANGVATETIGLVFTAAIAGGGLMTGLRTFVADRLGRRRILMIGAALKALSGVILALTDELALLVVAAIVGTISPSGREVGPFLSIEQAMLTRTTTNERRTGTFAAYSVVGSFAGGVGVLAVAQLELARIGPPGSYRAVKWGYAAAVYFLFKDVHPPEEQPATPAPPANTVDRSPRPAA